jgi:hypothetical protein
MVRIPPPSHPVHRSPWVLLPNVARVACMRKPLANLNAMVGTSQPGNNSLDGA